MSPTLSKKTDPKEKKILLVDDHPIVRQGLRQLIAQEKDLCVCGEAEEEVEALEIIEREKPNLLIAGITVAIEMKKARLPYFSGPRI